MTLFLTPRQPDLNAVSRTIIMSDGWRNVLELQGIQYAVSGRLGQDIGLVQLLNEGAAKRQGLVPEPDDASPWGASVDWDAYNDLAGWTTRAQNFVDLLRANLTPGNYAFDGWNTYTSNVPKSPDQTERRLSLQQIIDETLAPYQAQAAAVNIPATIHPALVAQPEPPNPNEVPAESPQVPNLAQGAPLAPQALPHSTGGGSGTAIRKGPSVPLMVGGAVALVLVFLLVRKG